MNNYKTQLDELFATQDSLNRSIDQNWLDIRTERDWIRAFWLELAELIESLPWKWWKAVTPDVDNIKIELVDCFHFLLSFILIREYKSKISLKQLFLDEVTKEKVGTEVDYKAMIPKLEKVVAMFLNEEYEEGIKSYCEALLSVMSFEDLYTMYMSKNMLNYLRQEYGYRQGTYTKIIDGKEDNEYLYEFIKQGKTLDEVKKSMIEVIERVNKRI
jgi:dimeric dUTPase (all-alpha-NTP-PPase superfamily)